MNDAPGGALNALRRAAADVLGEDQVARMPELLLQLARVAAVFPTDARRKDCPTWHRIRARFLDVRMQRAIWEAVLTAADQNVREAKIAQLELGAALAERYAPARPKLSALQVQALALYGAQTVDQVRAHERAAAESDQTWQDQYRTMMRKQLPRDQRWPRLGELQHQADRALEIYGGLAGLKRYAEAMRKGKKSA